MDKANLNAGARKTNNRYIVILAGGGGTRLWPRSRKNTPKQFLKLVSNLSMLQETAKRVESIVSFDRLYVVVAGDYAKKVKEQLPQIPEENILAEPSPKGSAAAAGLAAIHILKKDPDAIISTLASDHLIKKESEFRHILGVTQDSAESGEYLVTIGIVPTYPHTGLGYIHIGPEKLKSRKQSIFEVESFTEKPNLPTAQAFVATGEYFWNANINSYRAQTLINALRNFMPDHYAGLMKVQNSIGTPEENEVLEREWGQMENIPIDYGVLEKAKNVLIVPGDFGWSDIGDWNVLYEVAAKHPEANVLTGLGDGEHIGVDTVGCLIHSDNRLVATVGISDLVIVDTPDALLIIPRERAQDVKKIVEKLNEDKKAHLL